MFNLISASYQDDVLPFADICETRLKTIINTRNRLANQARILTIWIDQDKKEEQQNYEQDLQGATLHFSRERGFYYEV